jgi:hypothetical protein
MFNIGGVKGMASLRFGSAESVKNRLITGRLVFSSVAEVGRTLSPGLAEIVHAAKKSTC